MTGSRGDDDEGEGTVPVDRAVVRDDGTVVVDRVPAEEGTVVVDRAPRAEDRTVVIERGGPAGEHDTVPVDRDPGLAAPADADGSARPPAVRRRRRIVRPPATVADPSATRAGSGPDAVSGYPRREPPDAAPPAEVASWNTATRGPAPSMPSVERRSRRFGALGLAALVVAVVVAAVGLVALAVVVLSG
ncbi:MAG: hypothetical protein J0G30_04540 [Actinomycetales bacterium]|nr:hypothetical protein [Actinomycetales bacterium]